MGYVVYDGTTPTVLNMPQTLTDKLISAPILGYSDRIGLEVDRLIFVLTCPKPS